jgi:hypothetical protein
LLAILHCLVFVYWLLSLAVVLSVIHRSNFVVVWRKGIVLVNHFLNLFLFRICSLLFVVILDQTLALLSDKAILMEDKKGGVLKMIKDLFEKCESLS